MEKSNAKAQSEKVSSNKDAQQHANDEASSIANHFGQFFRPILATNQSQRNASHSIRHNVYCEELNFEPVRHNGLESDEFDDYSLFCLIEHITREVYAGTVRMVRPIELEQLLPIEKYCSQALEGSSKHPKQFKYSEVCEISRLAVPEDFRRRKMDNHEGASTGVINEAIYSETELRCFPFIAIGLYLSAAALCHELGIKHVFVMMEPRLARSMRFVGINFEQLGPTVDYHGKRAPYYIAPQSLFTSLSPGFRALLDNIDEHLAPQKDILMANHGYVEK